MNKKEKQTIEPKDVGEFDPGILLESPKLSPEFAAAEKLLAGESLDPHVEVTEEMSEEAKELVQANEERVRFGRVLSADERAALALGTEPTSQEGFISGLSIRQWPHPETSKPTNAYRVRVEPSDGWPEAAGYAIDESDAIRLYLLFTNRNQNDAGSTSCRFIAERLPI